MDCPSIFSYPKHIAMKIKEWAAEDRPREKMLLKGVASLSDAELLAILISSGNSNETAVQLSQRILNTADNNLNALAKLTIRELISGFKGIGEAKAITICAALELGKRRNLSDPVLCQSIRSSHDAYSLFHPLLCDLPHFSGPDKPGRKSDRQNPDQPGRNGRNLRRPAYHTENGYQRTGCRYYSLP